MTQPIRPFIGVISTADFEVSVMDRNTPWNDNPSKQWLLLRDCIEKELTSLRNNPSGNDPKVSQPS